LFHDINQSTGGEERANPSIQAAAKKKKERKRTSVDGPLVPYRGQFPGLGGGEKKHRRILARKEG